MSFYILADNCSDLPASRNTTCKDFQILNLSFFLDNAPGDPTIRSADFYNKLRAGSMLRTSQINPPEFEDVFRRIIAQGYHEILYLAFSSGLSGTYHSSTVAAQNIMKENPNVRILTVDTLEKPSQFHDVVKGDTLSAIAKKYYGDASKYPVIFEANKPMLTHPDKIYPGQKLRIPPL